MRVPELYKKEYIDKQFERKDLFSKLKGKYLIKERPVSGQLRARHAVVLFPRCCVC